MKAAERMRRAGWHRMCLDMWFRCIQGVDVIVWANDPDPIWGGEATMVIDAYQHGEQTFRFGTEGLPSLAQRAKAAARRLARKGRA